MFHIFLQLEFEIIYNNLIAFGRNTNFIEGTVF